MVTKAEQAVQDADVKRYAGERENDIARADGERKAAEKYTEGRDLANQVLGQSQAFMTIRKIADTSALLKLSFVKENKLYREIKTADGQQFTWAMYCDALNVSYKTVDEGILNLTVLGPDALEAMQSMGIASRDLRKLRKLPEEDRQIIIESQAIDVGDKEAVQELLEDMVVRHAKERESAAQREETYKQSMEALNALSETKNRRMDELAIENEKLRGGIKQGDINPFIQEVESEKGQIIIPLMRLKARACALEAKFTQGDKVDRAEYFALQAALDSIRDELAQAMDAAYNAGAPFQASIANAS
ncbi:MAG: hypothetical protein COZ00_07865, partial [Zetaproteobacteria bacterium CG_4_10_14_0_8_um_filter_49_80]